MYARTPSNQNVPSLAKSMEPSFRIGAAVNVQTLQSSQSLLVHHYNSLTAENDMKFESVQPTEGNFTFAHADQIVDFATQHGMTVRGHTLVWHNQTPDWVFKTANGEAASADLLKARMQQHIQTVVSRYGQKVYAWDVVNEAIDDQAEETLRSTPWLQLLGEDYLRLAYQFAHEANPDAKLFYNDYNETSPIKRDKIAALVRRLKSEGVPIHGIGMQGHWNILGPSIDEIKMAIECYAALDVDIHVTELDLSVFDFNDRRTDLTAPTEAMLEQQAKRYEDIFNLFQSYRDVIQNVTFWGVADDYTWLHDFPVRGRRNWPFLFDGGHQPKDSFWRVVQSSER